MGLLFPGVNRLYYNGGYWPEKIESTTDEDICDWLSDVFIWSRLSLVPTDMIRWKKCISKKPMIKELGEAGELCWEAF